MHKEKSHINDPTEEEMIGFKRDVSLIKTSSISEPSKKKKILENPTINEEIVLKQRSDQMDQKILEKRKKTEAEEVEESLVKNPRNKQAESSKKDEKNHNEKQENNVDINKKIEVKNKVNEKLIDHIN